MHQYAAIAIDYIVEQVKAEPWRVDDDIDDTVRKYLDHHIAENCIQEDIDIITSYGGVRRALKNYIDYYGITNVDDIMSLDDDIQFYGMLSFHCVYEDICENIDLVEGRFDDISSDADTNHGDDTDEE